MTREEIFLETRKRERERERVLFLIKIRRHVQRNDLAWRSLERNTRIFSETIGHIDYFAAKRTIPVFSQNNQLSPFRGSNCFPPLVEPDRALLVPLRDSSFIFAQHFRQTKRSKLLHIDNSSLPSRAFVSFPDVLKFCLFPRNEKWSNVRSVDCFPLFVLKKQRFAQHWTHWWLKCNIKSVPEKWECGTNRHI